MTAQPPARTTPTPSTASSPTSEDAALKARHAAMWALGDYPAVARELIPSLGPILVQACDIRAGDEVLDVATGSGNVALPAARTGATVTASDLTPALLEAGRAAAAADGLTLEWREADAEALPFPEASFDVVTSCVGVMFAPHHESAADELVRVLRPGGRLGLIAWTPEGFIGKLFAAMKPYAAAPPPGSQPPPRWGAESHVRDLLGDRVEDVKIETRQIEVHFEGVDGFRDYFKRTYGPTIVVYRGIADEPERVAALDAELSALAGRYRDADGRIEWEYLLLTARRSA